MNYIRHIKDLVHSRYVEEICTFGVELFNLIEDKTKSVRKFIDQEKFKLPYFIKSEESITRKILSNLKTKTNDFLNQTTYDEIDRAFLDEISSMRDIYRMVFELDLDYFEDELRQIIKALLFENKEIERCNHFDNSFKKEKNGYKDLKICFVYKTYSLEIQFHTQESNSLNKKTHGIYEVFRSMEPCDERESLKLDRNKLFDELEIPIIDEESIIELINGYYE